MAAEADAEIRADAQAAEAEVQAQLAEKTDADILAELDLLDPDEMTAGDDFSVFLTKAVPERLRRRALRKLWLTNPTLANVDGLVDYGEDYTDSALIVEGMQTAYQVGKGMLKHVEEMARQAAEAEREPVAEDDPVEIVDPDQDEAEAIVAADTAIGAAEDTAFSAVDTLVAEDDMAPPRRRMRFEFASVEAAASSTDLDPVMETQ